MTPKRPSRTAEAVCFFRAVDRVGPNAPRIVDDPYAAWFLTAPARAALAAVEASDRAGLRAVPLGPLARYVQVRHRYMDDHLVAALRAGRVDQVLVLGAGYDMRAYRFAAELAGRPVFEVDYPSTAARKARILARHRDALPTADVRAVHIDFQTQALGDVLDAAGFVRGRPTFVSWEGVSMYLDRSAIDNTLTTLRALGAVDLVMDFWSDEAPSGLLGPAHRAAPGFFALIAEPLTFTLAPADAPGLFAPLGWQVEDVAMGEALAERYGAGGVYPGVWCLQARGV